MNEHFLSTNRENSGKMQSVIDIDYLSIKQDLINEIHDLGRRTISDEDYNNYIEVKQQWSNNKTIDNIRKLDRVTQEIVEKLQQEYKKD